MYRTVFVVTGKSHFPIDMLRHDRCSPFEQVDVHRISFHEDPELRRITLIHYDRHPKWEPTMARWRSFGWAVVDCQKSEKVV